MKIIIDGISVWDPQSIHSVKEAQKRKRLGIEISEKGEVLGRPVGEWKDEGPTERERKHVM